MDYGLTRAMAYDLIEETAGAETVIAEIRRGIREADPPEVGPRGWAPLCLSIRDADGTLVGGIYGAMMWSWLLIDGLWVAASLRGGGLGTRLLVAAESAAVARGCRGVWLGTFDFQARGFYERHGYRVFGTLEGFPPGHSHYELWKALAPRI
jgi:GNAT superfamily N-acetyltransferase